MWRGHHVKTILNRRYFKTLLVNFYYAICFVLQFRVNEFGALEVITDESEMESVKKATATTTWMVPTAQEGQLRSSKHCLW